VSHYTGERKKDLGKRKRGKGGHFYQSDLPSKKMRRKNLGGPERQRNTAPSPPFSPQLIEKKDARNDGLSPFLSEDEGEREGSRFPLPPPSATVEGEKIWRGREKGREVPIFSLSVLRKKMKKQGGGGGKGGARGVPYYTSSLLRVKGGEEGCRSFQRPAH